MKNFFLIYFPTKFPAVSSRFFFRFPDSEIRYVSRCKETHVPRNSRAVDKTKRAGAAGIKRSETRIFNLKFN